MCRKTPAKTYNPTDRLQNLDKIIWLISELSIQSLKKDIPFHILYDLYKNKVIFRFTFEWLQCIFHENE